MRTIQGLQAAPNYPTVGFSVIRGRGNHVLLEPSNELDVLFSSEMKAADGVCLEVRHTHTAIIPLLPS